MRCINFPVGRRSKRLAIFILAWSCVCGAGEAYAEFQLREITASNGQANDFFGTSVDIFDGAAIVGSGFGGNAAYLFDFATGNQLTQLVPDDPASLASFGNAVAINADTALVGDASNHDPDLSSNEGVVYAFDAATGGQIAKLNDSNGFTDQFFGSSVAAGDGFAIAGAPNATINAVSDAGSINLFNTDTLPDFMSGSLYGAVPAVRGGRFGQSVSASGSTFVVGAQGGVGSDDANFEYLGAAFVFVESNFDPLLELIPDDRTVNDFFGSNVAISGGTVLVSSFSEGGSVYVFDATTGDQLFKLLPGDGSVGFGSSIDVAVSGNLALIGASSDDEAGTDAGAVYLFDLATGEQLDKIFAPGAQAGDRFGNSVALFGDQAIVGAFRSDSDAGAAYLFTVPEPGSAVLLLVAISPVLMRRRSGIPSLQASRSSTSP